MVSASEVREQMEVFGSDGGRVGRVERVEGMSIRLTKDSPGARGEPRYVPLDWVVSVDRSVHLGRPAEDVRQEWQAHPVQPGEFFPSQ